MRTEQGRSHWFAVASIAVGTFAYTSTELIPVGVLPDIAQSFGISSGNTGLMITMPGILAAVGAPVLLLAASKLNRKTTVIMLSLLLLISSLISASAQHYSWILTARALFGLGLGGYWALAIASTTTLVTNEKAPKAAAMIFAGGSVGMVLGLPMGTFLSGLIGWRGVFLSMAAVAMFAAACQYTFLPSQPKQQRLRLTDLAHEVKAKDVRRSLFLVALVFTGYMAAYSYVAPVFAADGASHSTISIALFGFGMMSFVSNALTAKALPKYVTAALLVGSLLMGLVLIAVPQLKGSVPLITLMLVIWGGAWGMLPVSLTTLHHQSPIRNEEASSVLLIATMQISVAIGSGIGGRLVDAMGLHSAYYFGACLCGIAVCALIFLRTRPARHAGRK